MAGKHQVRIRILDMEYQVLSDDEPERIEKIAEFLDARIREVRSSGPGMTALSSSVLTALNLAEELFSAQATLSEYMEKAADLREAAAYKQQLDSALSLAAASDGRSQSLLAQMEKLKSDNEELSSIADDYKEKYNAMKAELEANKRSSAELQNKLLENQIELIRTRKTLLEYGEQN